MGKVSLVRFKANRKGKIIEIAGGQNLHNKLMNLGLYKGKEITKLSHIGLAGPVVIKVGRSILALGHGVASKIIIGVE
ncbi:MAG: FeoA family protein [Candidatus Omnitrophota bacterium]